MSRSSGASRRSFLKGTIPAIASGVAILKLPAEALAQKPSVTPENPADISVIDERKVWSKEYWAPKGSIRLNMFRKRIGAAQAGQSALPILILCHGSSLSSRTSYDLKWPGHEYSLMNKFAMYGYDVWTLDFE